MSRSSGTSSELPPEQPARRYRLFWLGLIVAGVFWMFDSTVHRLAYGEERFELIPSEFNELWMRMLICLLFVLFGWYAALSRSRQHEAELQRAREQRRAVALTQALGKFLPICARCKSVRISDDVWVRIEEYIGERTSTSFSHGICPSCAGQLYPEMGLSRSAAGDPSTQG